ncbi:MAG: sodium:solute symporter [Deferribacteres bacterium]|nr:sodium:solute symporter [candidate division KSB1 bacterium]MCB9500916.1 sodium:solute symporter [Deferribacteres bacterium]
MEHYGWLSIMPPIVAIVLAIRTRQVFVSLLFGIWLGWVILSGWNFFDGTLATIQALVDVFADAGNTRTIMFSALVGALIAFIQRSGGVEGFILKVNQFLQHRGGNSRRLVQILAWLTGFSIFVESSINVLTVGSIFRPLFDKLKIPREKLAYIADSISAPTCILIPLNAWGAYIMGLLLAQGISDPLSTMIKAYPLNFYPILAMLTVVLVIVLQKDFGPMKKAEERAQKEGKVIADNATPMISSEVIALEKKEGIASKARNMLIPIFTMVFMMPIGLIFSGWEAVEARTDLSTMQMIFTALGKGSGSKAVLWAVLTSILVAMILYRSQKIFNLQELLDLIFKGIGGLIPLALLMMLAFAIGKVCKDLGAGYYIAEISGQWLSPAFVPTILFLVSCFIAFSTGTSWGTFAIMIPIGIPMAASLGVYAPLAVAAVLGGGVFGDHCSPISDTTIISSMASASDHIDHVKTQLPYALAAGGVAAVLYLIAGIAMVA